MKIKELIAFLSELDPDTDVYYEAYNRNDDALKELYPRVFTSEQLFEGLEFKDESNFTEEKDKYGRTCYRPIKPIVCL